jgi:nucleobase:cation symporter-1, NCS1 family
MCEKLDPLAAREEQQMGTDVVGRDREQPQSDRVWSIETNGINAIPDEERHGRPVELFWIWFAANVSILGMFFGLALVTFYGLNLPQALVAGVLGTVISFTLVGLISLAGKRGGAPTLTLSRAAFGVVGNALPTAVSYLALVGWETILVALASLAAQAILDRLGIGGGNVSLAIAFAVVAAVAIAIGLLGHATIVKLMTWFTWAFGALTVVFFAFQLGQVDWDSVSALQGGTFMAGFVGGMSVVAAGLGIGWINAAADYSRYLPHRSSSAGIVGWTVLGASLAPVLLIAFGILLAAGNDQLAGESNLIGALAEPLPTWFLVPYLLTAVGGLLAGAVIDMYSSGLNLLTLGLRLPRYQSILIDGAIMLAGNIYLLFFAQDFVGPFQGFLITLGVPLAAWGAVFLVDLVMYRWRQGYDEPALYDPAGRYGAANPAALVAWLVAVVVGLGLVTSTAAIFGWTGYLLGPFGGEQGAVGTSSIGLWIAFALAAVLYALLSPFVARRNAGASLPAAPPS